MNRAQRNEAIIADYMNGVNVNTMCDKFNLSRWTIGNIVRDAKRNKQEIMESRNKEIARRYQARNAEIIRLYQSGIFASVIAHEHNISAAMVYRIASANHMSHGRKRDTCKSEVKFRIRDEIVEKLSKVAHDRGTTRTHIVIEALKEYLK